MSVSKFATRFGDETGFVSLKVVVQDEFGKVEDSVRQAQYKAFGFAAESIQLQARNSIKTAPRVQNRSQKSGRFRQGFKSTVASPVGTPPYTHKGRRFVRAIRYAFDRYGAVVGFSANIVGRSAEPHEKGGMYKGQMFDQRPTIVPAMNRQLPRFVGAFLHSVGQ